jgi:hypothetical protein
MAAIFGSHGQNSLSLDGVFRPTLLGIFDVAFAYRENSVIRSRAQDD